MEENKTSPVASENEQPHIPTEAELLDSLVVSGPYKKLDPKAIRSLLQLGLFLLVIIFGWGIIGNLIFPQQPISETAGAFVKKYNRLLVQIAEELQSGSQEPGILYSSDVKAILEEGHIATQYADESGAGFVLTGNGVPDGGSAVILYRPDDLYSFSRSSAVWTQQDGALKWISSADPKAYVTVTKLADCFYLEVSLEPGSVA